jgi:hypothetical protein
MFATYYVDNLKDTQKSIYCSPELMEKKKRVPIAGTILPPSP